MCGAEALLLALKLAMPLVSYERDTSLDSMTLECSGSCFCMNSGASYYRCMAEIEEAKATRIAEHNKKVDEFRGIAKMCGVK